jgi:Ni/Fe-hydrogenase subunit HybB-like protein
MHESDSDYIPGACNIGETEIRKRKNFGYVSLFGAIVLFGLMILLDVDPFWRFLIFIPAFGAALGFIQAYMHFCAYFGLKSLYNTGPPGTTPEEVWEEDLRRKDRRMAWMIIGYSFFAALLVTLAGFFAPF